MFVYNQSADNQGDGSINQAFDRNYGNYLKSGDTTTLKYTIKDGDGEPLDKEKLLSMQKTVVLKHENVKAYETTFGAELEEQSESYPGDLVAKFKIEEVLPPSSIPYVVEFHFESSDERIIFPSKNNLTLYITPSALNSDEEAIKKLGEERLKEVVESSQTLTDIRSQEQERIAAETARQTNYLELVETGVVRAGIDQALAQHEQTYAPRLTSLEQNDADFTAQLAQTDNKEKEIRRNKKEIKAQFVFTDDDGHQAVLSKLKPIFTERNVPLTIALLSTSAVLRAEYGDEVLHLQNQHGWEISSHGNTSEGFTILSEAQLNSNLQAVNQSLAERGFNVSTVVYPNGQHNEMTRRVVSNYYKAGAQVTGGVNEYPLNTFNLSRHSIDDGTLEEHKEKVDEAFDKKGLLIFMSHCGQTQWDESRLSMLNDLIDYIKSKNGEITTLSNAIENVGNVVEVGDSISHGSVSISASGQAKMIQQIVPVNGTTVSTPATAFSKDLISVMHFNAANSSDSGFPYHNQGTLLTYRYGINDYGAFQIWYPYSPRGNSPSYKRIWIVNSSTWGEWSEFGAVERLSGVQNKYNESDLITVYPQEKITYFRVNTDDGFGGNGIVTTQRLYGNGFDLQIFRGVNLNTEKRRYVKTDGSWSEWVYLDHAEPVNSRNGNVLIGEYPSGFSFFHVNASANSGFPASGTIITYNRGAVGYSNQIFRQYNSFNTYVRYVKTDGDWSEWKQVQMM